jgi:hypothetical protein
MAANEGDVDVAELLSKTDKIKVLMRRDPRFIGRLITQLDKHMHAMMFEKHQRLEQIRADEEALAKIDATIASHITPNLVSGLASSGEGVGEPCWEERRPWGCRHAARHLASAGLQTKHCSARHTLLHPSI